MALLEISRGARAVIAYESVDIAHFNCLAFFITLTLKVTKVFSVLSASEA